MDTQHTACFTSGSAAGRTYCGSQSLSCTTKRQIRRRLCCTTSCKLYHEAKLEAPPPHPDISDAYHMELVCRARSVAKAYVEPDDRFAALLESTTRDLSTFIRYSGMEPACNESERMLRKAGIHRKIRQKMVTVGGKIMFGTTTTCLLTWERRVELVQKTVRSVLGDLTYYGREPQAYNRQDCCGQRHFKNVFCKHVNVE